MNVVWTSQAEDSINSIIEYLEIHWTAKEVINFLDLVEDTINNITDYPELFKVSQYDDESREAIITRHTTMFYRLLNTTTIEIEYFWGNFQDPSQISELLKRK